MAVPDGGGYLVEASSRDYKHCRTCSSLREVLDATCVNLYRGDPPVEYAVANEPWGSFAFRPGEVIALAAPPGTGKTAWIMQTAVDALRLNPEVRCLIANVEMTPQVLIERQLSRLSGVPLADITRRRELIGRQHLLEPARVTLDSISERMFFMTSPYGIERIIDAVAEIRCEVVVVDYLQRVQCCEGVADARNRINLLMQEIRELASGGVCVVVISAVARTPSKKGGGYNAKEIGLGSFRESSEIEYGCDDAYVMALEGPDDPGGHAGRRVIHFRHVKSRNHTQKDLRFEFDGVVQRFHLLPPRDERADGAGAPTDLAGPAPATPRSCMRTRRPGLPEIVDPFPGVFLEPDGDEGEG